MGAGNIERVYLGWAAKLNGRPMQVLIFMALTARDKDAEPWFGLGHAEIARVALGLGDEPADVPENAKARATYFRTVRRHITPLLKQGAITVRTRATFGHLGTSHVVYRLHLDGPDKSSPFDS